MGRLEAFLLLAAAMAFITSLLMRKIKNPYLYAWIAAPGVILHELTHVFSAWIFFARPVGFSMIPTRNSDGSWTLGSVTCLNIRWYNAFPVAVAPLLLFLAPYFSFILVENIKVDYLLLGSLFLVNMLVTHSAFPSRQDYKVAVSKPVGSFLWLSAIAYISVQYYQVQPF